jgi:hypothetical protein
LRQIAATQAREDPAPGAVNAVFGLPGGLLRWLRRPFIAVVRQVVRHEVRKKGSETVVEVS